MRLLLLTLILTAGCASKKPEAAAPPPPEFEHVDPAKAGAVAINVTFKGAPPPPKKIDMDAEPNCAKMHPKGMVEVPVVKVDKGHLANVVVYIKTGLEGKRFEPSKEAVVLEQKGCMYVPRVIAVQASQRLTVKNTDPISHNIHAVPAVNAEWNQQQPPESPDLARRFAKPEIMVPIKCNIHAWMKSYVAVLDHPYFGVTGADGALKWPTVPPGRYTIAAWHETLGELTQPLTVTTGATGAVQFAFEAK